MLAKAADYGLRHHLALLPGERAVQHVFGQGAWYSCDKFGHILLIAEGSQAFLHERGVGRADA